MMRIHCQYGSAVIRRQGEAWTQRYGFSRSIVPASISRLEGIHRNNLCPTQQRHVHYYSNSLIGRKQKRWIRNISLYTESSSSFPLSSLGTNGIKNTPCRYKSTAAEYADDSVDQNATMGATPVRRSGVRNVAIIAHVDHGKTTLVDSLLRVSHQTNTNASDSESMERLLDSGALEKERGITITSKVTRCYYRKDSETEPVTVNVVDTPGHADFCGEVDRVLSLVDGVCLVVDAGEGPMAQTKYVLSRAIELGLKPIVVLNKADRPDALARIDSGETESQLLDLFDSLSATDDQMDYVTLYASARNGWVTDDPSVAADIAAAGSIEAASVESDISMKVLLDHIVNIIPEPSVISYNGDGAPNQSCDGETFVNDKFSLAAVTVGYDQYLGRTCTGRIQSGSVSVNDEITLLKRKTEDNEKGFAHDKSTLAGIFVTHGISRVPLDPSVIASAGDIVTLAGVPDSIAVGDTVTGASDPVPYPIETPPLAPPTLKMDFGANSGPLAGTEGTVVTASKVRERLFAETDNNVTLIVERSETDSDKTTVYARGELQLGILIEEMRREGFELVISPPLIVTKECPETGKTLEPFEEVTIDVDLEFSGTVVSALTGSGRKGILLDMSEPSPDSKQRLRFEVPTRGLLGFNTEVATLTRGSAVVNHVFLEDRPHVGTLVDSTTGSSSKILSSESGKATHYALSSLAARGVLFVEPGDLVYPGMIIGESAKQNGDMEVNAVRTKAATNIRTVNKDEKVYLPPPKRMTVEEYIGYMGPDEMIEVTPKSIRLRKAELDPVARRKVARVVKQQREANKRSK